jgi:protocatechuate 3,4-dioxygenase beta subunit
MIRMPSRSRRLATASLLFAVSCALTAQTLIPPPPPPPGQMNAPSDDATPDRLSHLSGPPSWTISGVVISATTGTPLDRAEVTLSTPGQRGSTVAQTITAEHGSFRFDRLQAGRYRLDATRRGYITAGYQDHDGFYTGIVVGPHLNSEGLRLELRPTAIISGIVTDDAGEPVAGAQVRLFRQDEHSGESRIIGAGNDITDDTGAYEFARLRSGTYYVSVSASPWYAFHPAPKTDDSGNLLPADQQPRSPLDVAYSTTYYENSIDSDSATAISIHAGDRVEANLSLHAVPAIHIQIRLQPAGENRGISMPQLMQQVFGTEQFQQSNSYSFSRNGGPVVADLGGIAPGHYTLRQFGQQGDGTRTASVELTTDLSLDFAAVSATGVDVSGKLAMFSGGKLPERATVLLLPANGGPSSRPAQVGPDGAFEFHSIAPATYDFEVRAPGPTLSVAQIAVSGAESQGTRITVAAEPVLIAATLSTGSATITGYAQQAGKGFGGAMILLVPRDRNGSPIPNHDLYRRDQSNTDGSFTLNRVIPGTYTLVAIENGWTLDWARPDVIAHYLASGIKVQITNQKAFELPTPLEVDLR